MKNQKACKLSLINLLSNPDIKILDFGIENEVEKIDVSTHDDPMVDPLRRLTGRKFIRLTTYYDNPTPTK